MLSGSTLGAASASQAKISEPYAQGECGPSTRLQALLTRIVEAEHRVRHLCEMHASRNIQLTGHNGYPPNEVSDNCPSPDAGIIGGLESALTNVHRALTDLDNLTDHLRNTGIVA